MEKACRNYMGARRGGETDQQNVIMHKACWYSSIVLKNISTQSYIQSAMFTRRVARQTNLLYVLCILVKEA